MSNADNPYVRLAQNDKNMVVCSNAIQSLAQTYQVAKESVAQFNQIYALYYPKLVELSKSLVDLYEMKKKDPLFAKLHTQYEAANTGRVNIALEGNKRWMALRNAVDPLDNDVNWISSYLSKMPNQTNQLATNLIAARTETTKVIERARRKITEWRTCLDLYDDKSV